MILTTYSAPGVRSVSWSDVEVADTVPTLLQAVLASSRISTMYPVSGEPPVLSGGLHRISAEFDVMLVMATGPRGADGTSGTTVDEVCNILV